MILRCSAMFRLFLRPRCWFLLLRHRLQFLQRSGLRLDDFPSLSNIFRRDFKFCKLYYLEKGRFSLYLCFSPFFAFVFAASDPIFVHSDQFLLFFRLFGGVLCWRFFAPFLPFLCSRRLIFNRYNCCFVSFCSLTLSTYLLMPFSPFCRHSHVEVAWLRSKLFRRTSDC